MKFSAQFAQVNEDGQDLLKTRKKERKKEKSLKEQHVNKRHVISFDRDGQQSFYDDVVSSYGSRASSPISQIHDNFCGCLCHYLQRRWRSW